LIYSYFKFIKGAQNLAEINMSLQQGCTKNEHIIFDIMEA